MEPPHKFSEPSTISAQTVAPALAGVAIGLLVGARLRRRDHDLTAVGLVTAALAAGLPILVERIRHQNLFSPSSRRGAQRHLDGIRQGQFLTDDEEVYNDDLAERYRA